MRSSLTALLGLCLCTLAAQPTPSVRISTQGDRTKFYLGEAIPLKVEFVAGDQGQWRIETGAAFRTTRSHATDEFVVEPSEGTADPLHDRFAELGHSGGHFESSPAKSWPPVNLLLNEWISFRKSGTYAVTLRTKRANRLGNDGLGRPVELRSDPIQIEIVEPPAGWAAAALKRAQSVFKNAKPGRVDPNHREAAKTLRLLETAEAARAMAELAAIVDEEELIAGLWASPYRELVIKTMEEVLVRPDQIVNRYWLGTLVELAARRELPVLPRYPSDDSSAQKEWDAAHRAQFPVVRKHADRYAALLLASLPNKSPEAKLSALVTLLQDGTPVPPAAMREAMSTISPSSPLLLQILFSDRWPEFASAETIPLLEKVAFDDPSMDGDLLRPIAIQRLYELDPAGARRLMLREIPRARVGSPLLKYSLLPDRELPELDEYVVQRLAEPSPPWQFIARYATRRPLGAALAALEQSLGPCDPAAIAYLYRVAPEEAERRRSPACGPSRIAGNVRDVMSEGLEAALIEELKGADKERARYVAWLLGQAGTSKAEEPLWESMAKWRKSAGDPLTLDDRRIEQTYCLALSNAWGWLPSAARLDRLHALCVSDECRRSAVGTRKILARLNTVEVTPSPYQVSIAASGHLMPDDPRLADRIRLFPKGTEFKLVLKYRDTPVVQRLERTLHELFVAEGMTLQIESPAPAGR